MFSLALLALVSFLVALLLTPFVRNYALRRSWVDAPDLAGAGARKIHRSPIPRLGGVAILAAYAGAFGVLLLLPMKGRGLVELDVVARLAPAVGVRS
jgi:UDP-GlcNAc:undecaprenyl-phosphate GlcNAc-1-phosphate transferase